jgi:hypothetical protein
MSLLEQVLEARARAEKNRPPCIGCEHLLWIDEKTPFCREIDKFILPDFPPTKCEAKKGDGEMGKTILEVSGVGEVITRLQAELDHHKQEAEKIPLMCVDVEANEEYGVGLRCNDMMINGGCPQICPKYMQEVMSE